MMMLKTDDSEPSRYITVADPFQGDSRTVHLGKHDRFVFRFDEEAADFAPHAESVATIDVGTEISADELTEWCNSDAGQAALRPYFPALGPSPEDLNVGENQ